MLAYVIQCACKSLGQNPMYIVHGCDCRAISSGFSSDSFSIVNADRKASGADTRISAGVGDGRGWWFTRLPQGFVGRTSHPCNRRRMSWPVHTGTSSLSATVPDPRWPSFNLNRNLAHQPPLHNHAHRHPKAQRIQKPHGFEPPDVDRTTPASRWRRRASPTTL